MTIYEATKIQALMRRMALLFFSLNGWRAVGNKPGISRYVIIAAPHTSNWDFVYTLCLAFIFQLNPVIMMKHTWFVGPLGPVFRWLGALAIDRTRKNNLVAQSIEKFHEKDRLVLVVPPSGTRKRVLFWKTGFYRIAHGAGVPIVLGFLDYQRKAGGFGPTLQPTGDMANDMVVIRNFYQGVAGKNPLQASLKTTA